MQINGRDAFLYFCVLRAPFRHIQNHHAKIFAEYANRNPYHYPKKLIGSQAERIPGALASVADLRHHQCPPVRPKECKCAMP
jgi:hypothetical protein